LKVPGGEQSGSGGGNLKCCWRKKSWAWAPEDASGPPGRLERVAQSESSTGVSECGVC